MDKRTYNKIYTIAQTVRDKVLKENQTAITYGLCYHASLKLMRTLKRAGISGVSLIKGVFEVDPPNFDYCIYGEPFTHYWLEFKGNIIDITADQFNEELEDNMGEIVIKKYSEVPRYRKYREVNMIWKRPVIKLVKF